MYIELLGGDHAYLSPDRLILNPSGCVVCVLNQTSYTFDQAAVSSYDMYHELAPVTCSQHVACTVLVDSVR